MRIEIKTLGLAAYVKMENGGFVSYDAEQRVFTFDSDKSAEEWEIGYANSCCSRHDSELMSLRRFMR